MLAAIPTASAVAWSHLADERIAEFFSEDASFVAILTGHDFEPPQGTVSSGSW